MVKHKIARSSLAVLDAAFNDWNYLKKQKCRCKNFIWSNQTKIAET